jgi:hypothetical protein
MLYVVVSTIFGEELEQGQNHGFGLILLSHTQKCLKIKSAPQAPQAPQVVFGLSGESTGAGRSLFSTKDKPARSSTRRLTHGRYA